MQSIKIHKSSIISKKLNNHRFIMANLLGKREDFFSSSTDILDINEGEISCEIYISLLDLLKLK